LEINTEVNRVEGKKKKRQVSLEKKLTIKQQVQQHPILIPRRNLNYQQKDEVSMTYGIFCIALSNYTNSLPIKHFLPVEDL